MKKLLFVLAIAAFATACNDNTEKTTTTTDSTVVAPATVDTSMAAPVDTASKMMDTTKMTVTKDSTVKK